MEVTQVASDFRQCLCRCVLSKNLGHLSVPRHVRNLEAQKDRNGLLTLAASPGGSLSSLPIDCENRARRYAKRMAAEIRIPMTRKVY